VGKIGGLEQAEGCGGEHLLAFAKAGCAFYQLGRIPLAEIHRFSLLAQPFGKQIDLGGFTAAIDTFHDDQPAFIWIWS
jgi:hypothetical protein